MKTFIKVLFLFTIYGRIKMIEEIKDKQSKRHIARSILEALPDWQEVTNMKHRVLSVVLALCLCISSQSVAYAFQEDPSQQEKVFGEEATETPEESPEDAPAETDPGMDEAMDQQTPSQQKEESSEKTPEEIPEAAADGQAARNDTVPTPAEAYAAMTALQNQDGYKEGTVWTDYEPFSDEKGYYHWKGGLLGGKRISAVGCVAFAFILSDAAFGSLPARMYAAGEFTYEDIKVGDILRVRNDVHTVIVLEVSDVGVVVAEGNISTGDHKGKVHWGRGISREEVMRDTSHYITRYPDGYIQPDDPGANDTIADGTLGAGLSWQLTNAGTLTVSGKGEMPDFESTSDQPWSSNSSQIRKVVIGDGVTSIGACAFWNCGVISAEIASSVTAIGNNAFRETQMISVTIPSSVKTIGDSAFQKCQNLSEVSVSEGVEKIGQNAFRACTSLTSIAIPASIGEVGDAAFLDCTQMMNATFAKGGKQVKMGDNIFTRCYKLLGVTLPVSIDRIGAGMFQNCLLLPGVEIPQGAESIGESAFASCSGFTTVVIPDSVTSIGIAAFSACPLQDIYFTGSEAQWSSIGKMGDTASAVSRAVMHYNYTAVPGQKPDGGNGGNGNTDSSGNGNTSSPGNGNTNSPGDDSTSSPGNGNTTSGSNNNDTNAGNGSASSPGSGTNTNGGSGNSANGGNGADGSHNNSNTSENGNNFGGNTNDHKGYGSDQAGSFGAASIIESGIRAVVETWKPASPDERRRYACFGKENIRYTSAKNNAYQVTIENAMQGPMCFQSFEAVLGDYTIGRTYNIYPPSGTAYSMDEKVEITLKIPSAVYKKNREYKMICVTKGGQPFVYNDLDSDPTTITIETNKFYAYALIYR